MKHPRFLPMLLASLLSLTALAQVRTITADLSKVQGPLNTQFKDCIGAGRANEGLRADWQQQLAQTHRDCGFKYIRMHGLLTDDMGFYQMGKDGKPAYNYQYIDALYDFIVSIGMKPFVELGFMPGQLASGKKTIFWWRGNVTPPSDYNKWKAAIKDLTQHFADRYGMDEVKTWYFEVWNEPNLDGFWAGTKADYFKLYQFSVEAIKSVNKEFKVGGPATAGAAWVPEMIAFCSTSNLPLDFISTHTYGVSQGFLDEFGGSGTVLNKDKWSVSGDMWKSRRQIASSKMPHLELHYTEWSSSYTPADPIHDSYHEAAYILEKVKQAGNAVNSMSYWTFTDIFEEAGPRFTPFHGGFGLLNTQGIKKPAYQAFALLNKLGSTELQNADSSSYISKSAKGEVQLLFWDCTYTLPDSVNNQTYFVRDLPAKSKGVVKISLKGLAAGKHSLEVYRVGYGFCDTYTAYLQMGKPNQLSRQQVDQLKKTGEGAPVSKETIQVGTGGVFTKEFPIRENDVYMVLVK